MLIIRKRVVTLYELFNVSENASTLEIKSAYKKLAMEYHPDKVASSNDLELKAKAEHELIRINNAKDILLNPVKRADYDQILCELRSKADVMAEDLIVEMSDDEAIDIEWDTESFSDDDGVEEIQSEMPRFHKPVDFYEPTPTEPPRTPGPDFTQIQRRFLTFCPRCGQENLSGSEFCQICNTSLLEFDPQRPTENVVPEVIPVVTQKPTPQPAWSFEERAPWRISCPRCGTNNLIGRDHCKECNADLRYQDYSSAQAPRDIQENARYLDEETENDMDLENFSGRQCPNCGATNSVDREHCYICNMNLKYYKDSIPAEEYNHQELDLDNMRQNLEYQECPSCGMRNPIDRHFCESCYKNLSYNRAPPRPAEQAGELEHDVEINDFTQKKCPECGRLIYIREQVCPFCGLKFI
ncbi:double zinc ribbon domain-containing protein [[Eubacterium] cellulosolvens]